MRKTFLVANVLFMVSLMTVPSSYAEGTGTEATPPKVDKAYVEKQQDQFHQDTKSTLSKVLTSSEVKSILVDEEGNPLPPVTPMEGLGSEPATFGMIISAAEGVTSVLQNMLNNVIHNASVSFGAQVDSAIAGAGTQLGISIAQLKQAVGENITKPIDSLGYDVQQMAIRLANATDTLNSLIILQRACLASDVNLFAASLNTVAENLKSGLLIAKAGGPRLNHFVFDGHSKSVVPNEGGRVVISGFDIWRESDHPPEIKLKNLRGEILDVKSNQGASKDEVAFDMPKEFIEDNAGQCILASINVTRKEGILRLKKHYTYEMPMCIPHNINMSWIVKASTYYQCNEIKPEKALAVESFFDVNHDCDNRKKFGPETRIVNIDSDCMLIRADNWPGGLDRDVMGRTVGFTPGPPSSITVTGLMDTASCTWGHKWHHAVFQTEVRPVVQCTDHVDKIERVTSQPVSLAKGGAEIVVELPKQCNYDRSDFDFTIEKIVEGRPGPIEIGKSLRQSCNQKGCAARSMTADNISVNGEYVPGVAATTAQIKVSAKTASCGY